MKARHYIVSVLFLVFAIVQWNDPDPWLWILIYLFVAVVPLFFVKGRLNHKVLGILLIPLIVKTALYLPDLFHWIGEGMPTITGSMKAESPYIELIREFFGLVISLVVLGYYFFMSKKKSA